MKIFSLVLSLFLLLFTGCGGSKVSLAQKPVQYPSWYLNPPKSGALFLYGTGEGVNKKSATDAALNNIASKLSVSVESTFKNNRVASKSSYSQTITSDIKSSVKKISFNNYDTTKAESFNGKVLTLVRVDREKLFEGKRKDYETKTSSLDSTYKSLVSKDPISKLKVLESFNKDVDEAFNLAFLVSTINSNFSIGKDLKKFNTYKQEESKTKESLKLLIVTDKSSKLLKEPIKVALNSKKISVVNAKVDSKDLILVDITSRDKQANAMGKFIVKKTVNIDLKNSGGKTVSSSKKTIVGRSSLDFNQAQESASKNLANLIKKEGIFKVLGLKE